jgi:hypothetical protein
MHSMDVHVRYHLDRLQDEAARNRLVTQTLARPAAATPAADRTTPRRWQTLLQGRWGWDLAADPAPRPDTCQ